jgi:hypothetical protein
MDPEVFDSDLQALGFRVVGENRRGVVTYGKQANKYLLYNVHWNPDEDEVLFTWEFAVGEFFDARGMQIGSNESLNLFLFPQHDSKGPAEVSFIAGELDRAEQVFRSLDFVEDVS